MTEYNKAIRDKIPEIIKKSGFESKIQILSNEKFLIELEEKLKEELEEYNQSKSVEELADLLEVIERIAELKDVNLESLNKMKEQKAEKRGKFKKNLVLVETTKPNKTELPDGLPDGYYPHQCNRCSHEWVSKTKEPGTCSNQRCRSPYWNKERQIVPK